ncbi:hypothetical protein [Methylobacterium sp. WL8]|uniref:hypothetical protein n=1 Tax=Methylobacterium sp. WL8 TaxID=2603899 RepID=UPI0011CBC31F|nr:hypothetical protein [Methylobacterium sp. WL8]TXN75976.1 hypothetical protein FV234_24795 [Methylobacterium sp. WL8]
MKGKLRPSLHYRLVLLTRERRFYAEGYRDILQLQKLGLVEPTGIASDNGSQEWQITDAGRIALQDHDKDGT